MFFYKHNKVVLRVLFGNAYMHFIMHTLLSIYLYTCTDTNHDRFLIKTIWNADWQRYILSLLIKETETINRTHANCSIHLCFEPFIEQTLSFPCSPKFFFHAQRWKYIQVHMSSQQTSNNQKSIFFYIVCPHLHIIHT